MGDCWLLAGVNALSYARAGSELIKNSLEYEDRYTIVNLSGYGTIVVKDEELKNAENYSKGD